MGSTFTVLLPMLAGVGDVEMAREPASPPPVGLGARKILVVDDNQDSAASLGMLLRLLGAEVHVVFNGPDALEAIGTYAPDVVLLDIGMPGMDGHEVARRLRRSPNGRQVKLIALTGWGQQKDRDRSKLAGFDHHLIKPADIHALETALTSIETRPAHS